MPPASRFRRSRCFNFLAAPALWVAAILIPAIPAQAGPPPGYYLKWSDEFNGSSLNTQNWNRLTGLRRDAYNTTSAISVSNGCLAITTYSQNGDIYTGFIDTRDKVMNRYGYYEANIQYVNSGGNWSAFWLQSPYMGRTTNNDPADGVEIDIFEHRYVDGSGRDWSDGGDCALHWNGYGAGAQGSGWSSRTLGVRNGFHTYGFLWTPDRYRFYVDGKEIWTATYLVSSAQEYIRLTSEVESNSWAGTVPPGGYPSLADSPLKMLVDYVRFYSLDGVIFASTATPGPVSAAGTATLRGLVVPNGTNASIWFDWGTSTNYGNQTTPVSAGDGYFVAPVNAVISGLAPGQIYHYRLSASNPQGTIHSRDRIFTTGGRVKAWGGDGLVTTNIPPGLTNAVAIACGLHHGLALRNDGTVVAWGGDDSGQTDVPGDLSNVISLGAGYADSMALEADGTVRAWGDNGFGECNVPADLTNAVAISVGSYHNLALTSDGKVKAWGWNQYGQINVPADLQNVIQVAAGFADSLALKSDGTLSVWGDNTFGQTNGAAGLSNLVAVAAGQMHCVALRSDGTVTAWGRNNKGQTNVPAGLDHVIEIACGLNYSLALKSDGTVVAWGDGGAGQTNLPPGLLKVAQLSGSLNAGLAIADQLPQAENQTAIGYLNHDLEITLNGNDPDGNPLSYRITTLPAAGDLYQDNGGARGDLINAPGTLVTDSGKRVIFAPGADATGSPYATFGFAVNDGEYDSAAAQVTVNIGLPAQPQFGPVGWIGEPAAAGTFALDFTGSSNAPYSVWTSTNLLDWELIGAPEEISPGQYQFLDTSATNRNAQFYRVSGP